MIFRLAARNIRRNLRRSVITILAIAMGIAVLDLSLTLRTGSYKEMVHAGVSQLAGHVVLQKAGYQEDRETEDVLAGRQALHDKLVSLHPEGLVTTRSFLGGLLTSSSSPTFASLTAIDPVPEKEISDFDDKLEKGAWLDEDTRGILIGKAMAETLDVDIGDKLVFTGQFGPEMNSRLFRVKGVYRTGVDEVDAFSAFIHYTAAEELLQKEDVAHQIAVHLPNAKHTEAASQQTRDAMSAQGLEILAWQDALPEIVNMIKLDVQSNEFINIVLMIIVSMGVLNTMLMAVLERIKELGVLLALGMRPWQLSRMVLAEGLMMGLVGAALGTVLGIAFSYPLVANGLDMSSMMGEGASIAGAINSPVIYGVYDWTFMGYYAALGIVLSILSAVYPAMKIMKMEPIEAMRHH
jgi:ABC-type lipoprotein release transport system permease subunit